MVSIQIFEIKRKSNILATDIFYNIYSQQDIREFLHSEILVKFRFVLQRVSSLFIIVNFRDPSEVSIIR